MAARRAEHRGISLDVPSVVHGDPEFLPATR
jgi:hypothetical protein